MNCADVVLGTNNAYLVKRKSGGGVQFSRDPLNLVNKHSRKVNDIAMFLRSSYMFTSLYSTPAL